MDSTRRFCPPIPPNPRGAAASAGHRRAHSETFLQLPDDFLLDSDPDFGISDIDFPSLSDESLSVSGAGAAPPAASGYDPHFSGPARAGQHHGRSLSVDAAFFDGLCAPAQDSRETRHRRSGSMDGYTSPFEGESALDSSDYAKKTMAADKLAEISLMDPKRAKRR